MKWFLNFSTAVKLALGFIVMMAFLAFVIALAYVRINAMQASQKRLYQTEFANVTDLWELRQQHVALRAGLLAMMSATTRAEQQKWDSNLKAKTVLQEKATDSLFERNKADQNFAGPLAELRTIQNAHKQTRERQIIPLVYAGKMPQARALILGIQAQRVEDMSNIAESLAAQADNNAKTSIRNAEENGSRAIQQFLTSGAVALLLGTLMTVFLSLMIARPLKAMAGAAERIANGDLTVQVAADARRDEVGTLARSFSKMVANLQQVNRNITEGVNVLTTSSSEISASTTELAASSTQTATAVAETTTTVEEIRQTSQLASQKARQVAEVAQHAVSVAQSGRKSTEETGAGMQRIREQMEAIAEGMVRLAEQSQAIGQIIASVDDLAQQSNLLAVNAAIEAAKAGDQGKGFAVVAQEVKSLSDQSKQATMQVRAILTEIQKATSAAVLATEQGSKAVEIGVTQAEQAGEAILALSESVDDAAQAASQIAASSQQQLVGMDQVAQAMESIKQASTQNVEGARQLEEAARSLTELGQRLKEQVEQFKV